MRGQAATERAICASIARSDDRTASDTGGIVAASDDGSVVAICEARATFAARGDVAILVARVGGDQTGTGAGLARIAVGRRVHQSTSFGARMRVAGGSRRKVSRATSGGRPMSIRSAACSYSMARGPSETLIASRSFVLASAFVRASVSSARIGYRSPS